MYECILQPQPPLKLGRNFTVQPTLELLSEHPMGNRTSKHNVSSKLSIWDNKDSKNQSKKSLLPALPPPTYVNDLIVLHSHRSMY